MAKKAAVRQESDRRESPVAEEDDEEEDDEEEEEEVVVRNLRPDQGPNQAVAKRAAPTRSTRKRKSQGAPKAKTATATKKPVPAVDT